MLALTQHNASLSNLNIRIERHGDERQLAELLVREDVVLSITPPKRQAPSEDLSDQDAANDSDGATAAA